jgi:hypothetical protein
MHKQLFLVSATLALSAAAFGQLSHYQIGYAANLNVGDSVVNLSNDGFEGAFFGATFGDGITPAPTGGNICVNVYTFDPSEEEVSCCACLVTPNGLNSLSAKNDLINNVLTPAIPASIVIKLIASEPGIDTTGAFTICNPSALKNTINFAPYYFNKAAAAGDPDAGDYVNATMLAWGTTLEPASNPGTYGPVSVPYINGLLSASEFTAITSVCQLIQTNGTGYGICSSCALGALSGTKQ